MSVPVSGEPTEVEKLRKALRFYANHRNHAGVGVSAVYRDRGDTARRALGECQTCRGYVRLVDLRAVVEYLRDGGFRTTPVWSSGRGYVSEDAVDALERRFGGHEGDER